MKITSDKSIKIYNNVNIFHNYENEYVEKLAIDLSLYFSKKKTGIPCSWDVGLFLVGWKYILFCELLIQSFLF